MTVAAGWVDGRGALLWRRRLDRCGTVWGKVAEVLSLVVLDACVVWASVIGP